MNPTHIARSDSSKYPEASVFFTSYIDRNPYVSNQDSSPSVIREDLLSAVVRGASKESMIKVVYSKEQIFENPEELFSQDPELEEVLFNAIRSRCIDVAIDHFLETGAIKPRDQSLVGPYRYREDETERGEQKQATVKAWEREYVGDVPRRLLAAITQKCLEISHEAPTYARIVPMTQSSGAGKSRTASEIGKLVLQLPGVLRPAGDTGYPPADEDYRAYFGEINVKAGNENEVYQSCALFLIALLMKTREVLVSLHPTTRSEAALKFHHLMNHGMTFESHNPNRRKFTSSVIAKVKELATMSSTDMSLSNSGTVGSNTSLSSSDTASTQLSSLDSGGNPASLPSTSHPTAQASARDHSPARRTTKLSGYQSQKLSLLTVAQELAEFLEKLEPSKENAGYPLFMVVFDEAHELCKTSEGAHFTVFSELRRVARKMIKVWAFFMFLSTTGKLYQFTPSTGEDLSARVQGSKLFIIPPITELGFDQLALSLDKERKKHRDMHDLQIVTGMEYLVNLGRPMFGSRYMDGSSSVRDNILRFAVEKLLGNKGNKAGNRSGYFAVIATRIPLEFHPTNSNPGFLHEQAEQIQVAKHLRFCVAIHPGFTGAVTIAPSEPILAEAARSIMIEKGFSAPQKLLDALELSGMDKGDRGELVAMLLILQAYDLARQEIEKETAERRPYIPLVMMLSRLIRPFDNVKSAMPTCAPADHNEPQPLKEAFKDAHIYVTHFIRVYDSESLSQEHLKGFIQRGAAILCMHGQQGIDIGLPYLCGTSLLGNAGLAMIQVKNDATHGIIPWRALFNAMDPFKLGIVGKAQANIPILRLVFALGSQRSIVMPIRPARRSSGRLRAQQLADMNDDDKNTDDEDENMDDEDENVDGGDENVPDEEEHVEYRPRLSRFVAYDVWCAGMSQDTWHPIKSIHTQSLYKDLINLSNRVNKVFELPKDAHSSERGLVEIRQMMVPCATASGNHWRWKEK